MLISLALRASYTGALRGASRRPEGKVGNWRGRHDFELCISGRHVGDDMRVVDEALRALKEKLDGVPSPATIRRIRRKLKLSQRKAGELLKVGENAFDKYERGLVEPSGPTSQLIMALDRHPEIVEELRVKI
jgi:putative zinc finger/helix-turn-helix YgiT family protein